MPRLHYLGLRICGLIIFLILHLQLATSGAQYSQATVLVALRYCNIDMRWLSSKASLKLDTSATAMDSLVEVGFIWAPAEHGSQGITQVL